MKCIGKRQINRRETQQYPRMSALDRNETPPYPRLIGTDYRNFIFKINSEETVFSLGYQRRVRKSEGIG